MARAFARYARRDGETGLEVPVGMGVVVAGNITVSESAAGADVEQLAEGDGDGDDDGDDGMFVSWEESEFSENEVVVAEGEAGAGIVVAAPPPK